MAVVENQSPGGQQQGPVQTQQDSPEWVRPENWPSPSWYDSTEQRVSDRSYENYIVHRLRTQYMALESDFLLTIGNPDRNLDDTHLDRTYQERIVKLLRSARKLLEQERPDRFKASSTLNLIERYMVWIYSREFLRPQSNIVRSNLETMEVVGGKQLIQQLDQARDRLFGSAEGASGSESDGASGAVHSISGADEELKEASRDLRAVLDEARAVISQQALEERINTGLRIQRLISLRKWGWVLLGVFLAVSPLITNIADMPGDWPSRNIVAPSGALASFVNALGVQAGLLASWLNALGITIVGALGGFLSGLIQARSSQISLAEHQEYVVKLTLKPLVGALAALALYVFLSWPVIPEVTIEGIGSYVVIAFLAGFSERFFLRLLDRTGAGFQGGGADRDELESGGRAARA